jgi:hypothetical protein
MHRVEQLFPREVFDECAPNDSKPVSVRFGIAFIAPFGRSRSFKYMLSGEVKMWRNIVMGNKARNAMKVKRG